MGSIITSTASLATVIALSTMLATSCSQTKEKGPPSPAAPTTATKPAAAASTPTVDSSAQPTTVVFDFEDGTVGALPPGFTAALVGGGGSIDWRVQARKDAHSGSQVIAQLSSDQTNTRYPHVVRDDLLARDVDVSVSFKTIGGKVDASGGVVFRYLDKNNFYVVRANSLEGNVVAYKTEKGIRRSIGVKGKDNAYGVNVNVPHQQWNDLRVMARGQMFEVFLNGKKLFEAEDDTFTDAGKVGLWTKADAVTEFDDLRVVVFKK